MSFQKRFKSGEFVVIAEMDMPKGVDISEVVMNARRIKGRVDAIVIPDMGNGVMKMSALGGGLLLSQEGLEPIMQICCRDRNRIALQGDLLSAHVLGIRSLVVVPGDDISYGDQIDAKPVNDLDAVGLLKAILSLQDGKDLAGIELKGAPSFVTGATMAPAEDGKMFDDELDFARKKIEAGAGYLNAPPVFDIGRFQTFLEKTKGLNVPIIPTVYLLKSVGMARYMATNLPGVYIPEELIKRIRQAADRVAESVRIAGETVKALKGLCQGVNIVTLGWEFRLPEILDAAGM